MTVPHLSTRARTLLVAGAVGAVALAATGGGELSTRAARATIVLLLLAAVAYAVRHPGLAPTAAARSCLAVRQRQPLGRDTGVAMVAVDGRRILVGFGPQGVTCLAELAPEREGGAS